MILNKRKIIIASILFRLVFLIYGFFQDKYSNLRFTDIDYDVFSDAAEFVRLGKSPYLRSTYRYTPLLAWILTGNGIFTSYFGKIVFSFCDVWCVYLIYAILDRTIQRNSKNMASLLWGLNPFVATISARGSAESILAVMSLSIIYFWQKKQYWKAAAMLGLGTHFKVYPVIYAVPLWFSLKTMRQRFQLGVIAATVYILLVAFFYSIYGFEFLQHTYLYHVTRIDHRHNFSLWFYYNYLTLNTPKVFWHSLVAFLPQLVLVALSGYRLCMNLPLAMFAQTFVFVIYNKVSTSQYFMWYLCFLPILLPFNSLRFQIRKSVGLVVMWVFAQAIWLYYAFKLEMLGESTFRNLYIASAVFFCSQMYILEQFVKNQKPMFAVGSKKSTVELR